MIRKSLLLIFFVVTTFSYAQEATYEKIKKLCYEEYEYEKVIQLSNELIKKEGVEDSTLINLYLMRAISFYALDNENLVRISFENILKIKKTFTPDIRKINTKIIVIFNEVKAEFIRQNPMQATTPEDVAKIISLAAEKEAMLKAATIKNILVPGWGQMALNSTTKGILMGGLSTANLAAMIYYVFDTNKKEDAYLKETNKFLVDQKYASYNSSYKTRNILIATYAALWIYSQIDLHFFNNTLPDAELQNDSSLVQQKESFVNISIRFPL
ncbi:MAG: hypothetical protein A2499_14610 [Stygiobacter sp. RIFOXYC12_FULL_38_8]|nr:MAG: hypothetical protein A2X62_12530 [Stygiobacter sp. GWC2_38_9]OGV07810.1 MAG: hypothetical protein A2299_06530 [Stygiobacter sp. RIFOXYB2_FULL_37_11]OGV11675.1 MAG: hypothetical protein A2237_17985 [Stygiobacter sp. RIFOXYA2_FULL_38_8]OGV12813.1 MAG: hypothetical protein A2440_16365 [Stygiobacter sp. RIFOXYC2_FULL_38_25]OGV27070.1 MAG: hypothetical protein A2499_14610 [Stygiobacter sp. RIFOXYC12_FULL_38_8]OGV81930.1 MAG: hypothetical protein A2X65_13885 [Stygiobacter sp. GWF2_38_21]RJQ